jgi:HEAT repeat protein
MEKIPKCRMNIYPALTISLLSQLTNRELQFNYLNHLDRTAEIASLLTQITDPDLALRIVNLALEVDLCLGAKLTASIEPALQQIIVDGIDRLEIPTRLKIDLWHGTKSKAALPYLQNIFIFKHLQADDRNRERTISSAISVISCIDRDLAVALLIEDLSDSHWNHNAAEHLSRLAPVEAIEHLAPLLSDADLTSQWNGKHLAMAALEKIGTDEAISKIREVLADKSLWSQRPYIYGLGIVADPSMVEHLIYLLYEPEQYIHRSIEYPADEEYYANEAANLHCEAIDALERVGGKKVFDWLHQSMYWISPNINRAYTSFDKIIELLFKLDRDRTLTALEGAIKSYDPKVRKLAAIALSDWKVPVEDRNIIILLNALDEPNLDVQLTIIDGIREKIDMMVRGNYPESLNIFPELIDRAILATKPIILKYINHPDPEIRDRAIRQLSTIDADERYLIECVYIDSPTDLPTQLKLLDEPQREIRESAVISIVELGTVEIFSTVLELASDSGLVAILISELEKLADDNLSAPIFSEFHRDRDVTLKFIETAEKTCVQNIRNKTHRVNDEVFALQAIGDDLAITALQEILEANDSYDDIDQSIPVLANIGKERAVSVLLSFLPDIDKFYGWIAIQLYNLGRLGLVPQLWAAAHQFCSDRSSETISRIQEREGLYNPDFSDRSHPLFEPPRRRLRDILLGNTTSEI